MQLKVPFIARSMPSHLSSLRHFHQQGVVPLRLRPFAAAKQALKEGRLSGKQFKKAKKAFLKATQPRKRQKGKGKR
jgi:hypothetical protein